MKHKTKKERDKARKLLDYYEFKRNDSWKRGDQKEAALYEELTKNIKRKLGMRI